MKTKIISHLKLMRFDHWIKNLFMLPGIALAYVMVDNVFFGKSKSDLIIQAFLSLIALCLVSSSNYVINEWLDRDKDSIHPMKNHRIASKFSFSARNIYLQYASILILTFVTALTLETEVKFCLALLAIMGIIYNVKPFRFKDEQYLDVITESINNPLRLSIGWYALSPAAPIPLSAFLSYWGVGIFLMSLKRYSEMRMINNVTLLATYRKSFEKWTPDKLLVFALVGAMTASTFGGVLLARHHLEYVFLLPAFIWIFAEYLKMSLALDPASYAPEKLMRRRNLHYLVAIILVLFTLLTLVDFPKIYEFVGS